MEVKLNIQTNAVPPAPGGAARSAPAKPAQEDATTFIHAEALNQALKAAPDTQPENVARAKALVADVHYPPAEIIQRLARLLALHLDSDTDDPTK